MKKQKLAFIIPSLNAGGAERVVSTLSNQLVESFEVIIVVLYNDKPFYKLDDRVTVVFCKEYNSDLSLIQSLKNHYSLIKKCREIIRYNNINIILGFTTTANIYATLISKRLKIPSIISERIHPEFNTVNRFWTSARRKVYPKANALVVQTQSIQNYFRSFIKSDKISIINNPLSEELVEKRKSNNIKENYILCVGRLSNQKNQELLIRAFANIHKDNWELLLIGEGKNRKLYEELISKLHLKRKVRLLGNIEDISKYYNTSKIFVLPSNFEGFPNALIEAMYFGLACIATDCPSGPSEIIKDGTNGYLIPVNDQKLLEEKLTLLIQNEELQQKLSENAKESTAIFDAAYITNQWKVLIEKVIQE